MNPEELIALLKALFKVKSLSPTAMRNLTEAGEVAPGMTRMFRGEAAPGAIKGAGQMFTRNPEAAAGFANLQKEPMVNMLDVPNEVAERGSLPSKGVSKISGSGQGAKKTADESSFVVGKIASRKKQIFPSVAVPSMLTMGQYVYDEKGNPVYNEKGEPLTTDNPTEAPPLPDTRVIPEGLIKHETNRQTPFKGGSRPMSDEDVDREKAFGGVGKAINEQLSGAPLPGYESTAPKGAMEQFLESPAMLASPTKMGLEDFLAQIRQLVKGKQPQKLLSAAPKEPFKLGGEANVSGVGAEDATLRFPESAQGMFPANEPSPRIAVNPSDKPAYLGESGGINPTTPVTGEQPGLGSKVGRQLKPTPEPAPEPLNYMDELYKAAKAKGKGEEFVWKPNNKPPADTKPGFMDALRDPTMRRVLIRTAGGSFILEELIRRLLGSRRD